ncbi:hypothetical protein HMPREF9088_1866 [Enterococcus italicus DSM 15952]|uniref:Uncharacterized protein n=1 Tax=Enterococcus italicus (strain DSM 15952 / CCUG 50447 / LMG 22039 / TP 1.5) TaxID=888064 RepID=E6LHM6_ENTI1|nr:hypothetical protein HMPREF9088_1866 [Enterococcus italicus DSM 15952]
MIIMQPFAKIVKRNLKKHCFRQIICKGDLRFIGITAYQGYKIDIIPII